MKRFAFVLLTLFLILEVATLSSEKQSGVSRLSGSLGGERAFWTRRIREVGAQAAYDELKKKFEEEPHGRRHTMTHLFGELLYETNGVDGVTMCDNTNEFGCFHGFFTTAVRDKGETIVHELDLACVSKYGTTDHGCQHGIGHGVLEYFGSDRLIEALELCSTLSWKGDVGGCGGGVFMEYNMPTLIGADEVTTGLRPMEEGKQYEPCYSLPQQFRHNCLHNQVQWWGQHYDHDFTKLGELCAAISDSKEQRVCYRGIGQIAAPTTNYEARKTIENCKKLPTEEAVVLCRQQASWSTYASFPSIDTAPLVCEGMPEDQIIDCASWNDVEMAKDRGVR